MPDSTKKYQFKLLREEASDVDVFESKTHENIAASLFEIIRSEEKAITIGLEGPWGTGKSTVVRILQKKLSEEKDIFFTQFDAWAHEGDPLRRIFLENLIKDISEGNDDLRGPLTDLRNHISGKQKTIVSNNEQGVTLLGKIFAMSLLLVPIGSTLLGKVEYDKLFQGQDSELSHFLFFPGIILIFAPFLVLVGNWFRVHAERDASGRIAEDSQRKKDWLFLQNESVQTVTQSVTEGPDRSSIEFESYFEQIIGKVLSSNGRAKIVLILDNLDRISVEEALKTWAVLQTFLQQRNLAKPASWFDNIWVIVPYDYTGLSKLWKTDGGSNNFLSKSFFDKSFQLRIDVPKPIFKDWEGFAKKQMEIALANWEPQCHKIILNTLRIVRSDLNDIPTPREIKNYINQVGLIASQRQDEINIDAIAYYVNWREMLNVEPEVIRESLLKYNLAQPEHHQFLNADQIVPEIAALCFGVSLLEAKRFLLSEPIQKALAAGNNVALAELAADHGTSFWVAFEKIRYELHVPFVLNAARAIYLGLWEEHSGQCAFFASKIRHLPEDRNFEEFQRSIENYAYWIYIAKNPGSIYNFLISQLDSQLGKKHIKWQEIGPEFVRILEAAEDRLLEIKPKRFESLGLRALETLVSNFGDFVKLAKVWHPNERISGEIVADILGNVGLLQNFDLVLRYIQATGQSQDWRKVFDACLKTATNSQVEAGNLHKVILELLDIVPQYLDELPDLLENRDFYRQLHKAVSADAAYLWGLAPPSNFNEYSSKIGEIIQGINKIRAFWETPDKRHAQEMLDRFKKYRHWKQFWRLTKKQGFGLFDSIFEKISGNSDFAAFYENATVQDVFEGLFSSRDDEFISIITDFRSFGRFDEKLMQLENLKAGYLENALKVLLKMEISQDLRDRITAAQ